MRQLRWIIPVCILVIAGVAFAVGIDAGTLSGFGWRDIALLCPVGALSTMLAAKTLIPRALISLVLAVVAILLLGRAFCGWACPVPLAERVRAFFTPQGDKAKAKASAKDAGEGAAAEAAAVEAASAEAAAEAAGAAAATEAAATAASKPAGVNTAPLTARELKMLRGCGTRADAHGTFDSRHIVLGAGLLSAAIFGFPVICLVCPIGLTFATIFLLIRAFGFGDPSWALIIIPVILVLELFVFRKWCHWICPVSALMSLVAKGNKTVQPTIDDSKCLETSRGAACGVCGRVCPERIDVRHPELGNAVNECTRCRICADACPGGAISFPFLAKKAGSGDNQAVLTAAASDVKGE